MRLMRRPSGPLAGLLLAFLALGRLSGHAYAQTSAISSPTDALQVFQGLSPQEQQAILGRLGGGGGIGGVAGGLGGLQGQLGSLGSLSQGQLGQLQQQMTQRRRREEEQQRP